MSALDYDTTAVALESEHQLCGAALAHSSILNETSVESADFANPRLGALWHLMCQMHNRSEPVSPTTVAANLSQIADVRGVDHGLIFDLYHNAPVTPIEGVHAARAVSEAAVNRGLESAGTRIVQLARGGGDVAEKVELARAEIDGTYKAVSGVRMFRDIVDDKLHAIESPSPTVPTPWDDLNKFIRGWRPGALYVIGARPGIGKTIIGLQAAIDLAQRGPVAVNSLEMGELEVAGRIMAQTAEVALGRLDGESDDPAERLSTRDWENIARARPQWDALPLAIDDRSHVSITDIRSHARTLAHQGPLAGIVVDYLQLMSTPRSSHRQQRHEVVADFSRSLKLLAKELNCPVIALSQLNRASEGRHDKKPTLADIRESGAVEQDSDVVMLLSTDEKDPSRLDLHVAKNRHGVNDVTVELTRQGHYARAVPREWSPSRWAEN